MSRREVFGPDGRSWEVTRRPEADGLIGRLSPRSRWVVEAATEGPPAETRQWYAERRSAADDLVETVAMALRTGSEGPPEPLGQD